MGDFSCLFQSIPGTVDLGVNVFGLDQGVELVVFADAWGYHVPFEADLFGVWEDGHQVHIGDVTGSVSGIGGG